ncbi:phospholipase/carboxylesterase [Fibrisoma limi BUZ 3]|uniref:Phospholipase/carboxylesterase n=1 Tax=Fibrisoma limi BUZ 3 TaxID=1185876 RepID=I2GGF5_9BACT|nr:dienelactone hydrolase family protein [Fibrisoma limi]CCH52980.1 phospholipase/carboxylesterase [Fibrisoma limi BUZ 3]
MTKSFYQRVCVSLGLTLAVGLFQNWLHFQLGIDVYMLPSFPGWFLVVNVISLLTSILLLLYYHHKQFQAAFWSGLVVSLATFGALLYLFLARLYPVLGKHPDAVVCIGIVINLVYATSLFVSKAATRPWLKRTGFVLFTLYLAQLATLAWFINTPPYPLNATLDAVRRWLSFADRIVPVLLLFNFADEYQNADPDKEIAVSVNRLLLAKGLLVLLSLCSLVLSFRLVGENYDQTHVSLRASTLAKPFDEGSYISSRGDTLYYRLLKPIHYDPRKKYPLVVGLPYSCWSDNTRQIDACPMAKWLATDENRRKYPAFVFVPRCPPHTGWGGVPNTPSVTQLAIEAIIDLDKTYSIDPHRRYVTGVSRGGYGSWHMIGLHPELFAAAIPVCGEGNPDQAKNMTAVSVWAFHGAKDKNVPVSGSRKMINAIKKAGGRPRYTEYPDAAHGIWEEVIKTPGLLDWLFYQKQTDHAKAAKRSSHSTLPGET